MALAPTDIKVAGHWKSVDQVMIKIGGHWKPVDQIMEKVAGHWKLIGGTLHPPLFTGAIGDLQAVVGEAFTKDVSHLFSTGPVPASYSLNNPPAGMVISNAGVISWPNPVKGDTSGVSVTATNSGGFVVSDAFGVSAIALGPELFIDPGFDDPTKWLTTYSWEIVGGAASQQDPNAGNGGQCYQKYTLNVGRKYTTLIEVLTVEPASGPVRLRIGGGYATTHTVPGVYREIIASSLAGAIIGISDNPRFLGTIGRVSLREILP